MEKKCIAMLLAGGQGSRLGALTKDMAKPAVSFGGKYRMVDFALSNCCNSEIDTVGVLTQYRPFELNAYLANGSAWDFSSLDGGIYVLPPYETQTGGNWYRGTADAIYRNIDFIKLYHPKYVLILSADHLYRMDYRKMLESHIAANAECTLSTLEVPWEDASRFGLVFTDENNRVTQFIEKPKNPPTNLASMGIYIFNADTLIEKLEEDGVRDDTDHDFGKNILPTMLSEGRYINNYTFDGFWQDVGTIPSYYETSLALLDHEPAFDLYDEEFPLMSNSNIYPAQYIGPNAEVKESMINSGCKVLGKCVHSLISNAAIIEEDAVVEDSVLLPGAVVKKGAHVVKAVLGEEAVVEENVVFGDANGEIAVLGNGDHATL